MAQTTRHPRIEEVQDEEDTQPVVVREKTTIPDSATVIKSNSAPEHPYQNVKDAAYAPSATRNVGAPIKALPVAKKQEPAYKTLPPIHDPLIATEVYKRSMDAPITITQRELLSLSPEVRSQVRDITTTRRVPNNSNIVSQNVLQVEEEESSNELVEIFSNEILHSRIQCRHLPSPPPDAIIVPDPIEHYY